jgi:F0F1-type ATP synthase alpha subunit
MRALSGALRVELAQYRELASFSQFGSDLNQDTRDRLNHGERVVEVFKQMQYSPVPVEYQVIVLYMLTGRYFSEVPVEHVHLTEREFIRHIQREHSDIAQEIKLKGVISPDLEKRLKLVIEEFMRDRKAFMDYMQQNYSDLADEISRNAQISAELRQRIRAVRMEYVEYGQADESTDKRMTGEEPGSGDYRAGTGAGVGAGTSVDAVTGAGTGSGAGTGTGA